MKLGRFLAVVIFVIAFGGAFGAVVGGLLGLAVPDTLASIFTESHEDTAHNTITVEQHRSGLNVAIAPDENKMSHGAAVGAAGGLMFGLLAGVMIGVADQVFLLLRTRPEGSLPGAGAAR